MAIEGVRGCDTRPASSSVAYTASYDGKRLEVVEENRWQDALHSHKVVYNVSSSFRSIFCRRQGACPCCQLLTEGEELFGAHVAQRQVDDSRKGSESLLYHDIFLLAFPRSADPHTKR